MNLAYQKDEATSTANGSIRESLSEKDSLANKFAIIGESSGNSRKTKLYGNISYKINKLDRGGCGIIIKDNKPKRVYGRIFIRERS